jgi:hypothetical protein
MQNKTCKVCGKPAHNWTVFGVYLGDYCNRCYRDINQRVMKTMEPFRRQVRDSFDRFCEEQQAVDPECKPIEYAKICEKCEDKLIGHEDESGTHCRWCVTCTDVTEGESLAIRAESNA